MHATLPLLEHTDFPAIAGAAVETLQVNLGYLCNQQCLHCHVNAGPNRKEMMSPRDRRAVLALLRAPPGDAARPHRRRTRAAIPISVIWSRRRARSGVRVIDRCNLTILEEPGQEDLAAFLAAQQVEIVASLPCYLEENVDRQRGRGVFEKSISGAAQAQRARLWQAGSGLELCARLQPAGAEPAAAAVRARGGLPPPPAATATASPSTGCYADQHADPALRQSCWCPRGSSSRLHGAAQGRPPGREPRQVMCRRPGQRRLAGLRSTTATSTRCCGIPLRERRPPRSTCATCWPTTSTAAPIAVADHCYGCTAGQGSSCGGALAERRIDGARDGADSSLLALRSRALVIAFFAFDLGQYPQPRLLQVAAGGDRGLPRGAPAGRRRLIYFAVYVAVTGLSLPGAALMTLAGGAMFGLLWGTLIVSFASTIGATLAFLAARFLLRDWVQTRFGDRLGAINAGIAKDGALLPLHAAPGAGVPVLRHQPRDGAHADPRTAPSTGSASSACCPATLVYVNAGTQLAQDRLARAASSRPACCSRSRCSGFFPLVAKKVVDAGQGAQGLRALAEGRARFDRNLVVIGAGSAGLVSAYIAAAVKAKVTLIEKHRMGGDCLNTGCVPSKALIRSAKLLSHMPPCAGVRHPGGDAPTSISPR